MHAAQCAYFMVEGDIGLGNERLQPVSLKLVLAKGACEKPAAVLSAFEINDVGAFELGFREDHPENTSVLSTI
jgi:hypothetical protein